MPTPTIRLRITERLAALIERVWNAAPELRDDFPATVLNAFALYAEYREGRPSIFGSGKSTPLDQPSTHCPSVAEADQESSEDAQPNPDDDWA